MGSSPSINIPPQQGYGEALSESLRAQVDLLSGRGDFEDTGGLQNLLETYEAPFVNQPLRSTPMYFAKRFLVMSRNSKSYNCPTVDLEYPMGKLLCQARGHQPVNSRWFLGLTGTQAFLMRSTGGVLSEEQTL